MDDEEKVFPDYNPSSCIFLPYIPFYKYSQIEQFLSQQVLHYLDLIMCASYGMEVQPQRFLAVKELKLSAFSLNLNQ